MCLKIGMLLQKLFHLKVLLVGSVPIFVIGFLSVCTIRVCKFYTTTFLQLPQPHHIFMCSALFYAREAVKNLIHD